MTFQDIIGQEDVKQRLLHEVETGRLPHALLLAGPEGNGGFALAWALASRLLNNSSLVGKMQHPDLYFSNRYSRNKGSASPSRAIVWQRGRMGQAWPTPFYI